MRLVIDDGSQRSFGGDLGTLSINSNHRATEAAETKNQRFFSLFSMASW
jgi:hypothetical protein